MAVGQKYAEFLVCPKCKGSLVLVHEGAGLKCERCHRVYPIVADIPILREDEAIIEDP